MECRKWNREPSLSFELAVPSLTTFTDIKLNRELNLPVWRCRPYQLCNRAISPTLVPQKRGQGSSPPAWRPRLTAPKIVSTAATTGGSVLCRR